MSRLPKFKAKAAHVPVAHVALDTDDVLVSAKLKRLPLASNCLAFEAAQRLIVLIHHDHSLHIVQVFSDADGNFLDVSVLW